jgi:hypothetical protein
MSQQATSNTNGTNARAIRDDSLNIPGSPGAAFLIRVIRLFVPFVILFSSGD